MAVTKTPAHKQRRTCVDCGLESTPGGMALHQKATGHEQWTTPEAYSSMKADKLLDSAVNKEVDRRIDSEVKTAVEVALNRVHHQYDQKVVDLNRKHQKEITDLNTEISDLKREVDTARFIVVVLMIVVVIGWVVLAYIGFSS